MKDIYKTKTLFQLKNELAVLKGGLKAFNKRNKKLTIALMALACLTTTKISA